MNMYELVILLLTAFYVILMLYYLTGWLRLKEFNLVAGSFHTRVSIIIPARNEEKNILNCVNDILAQHFPKELFEIIVVDDFSADKTAEIAEGLKNEQVKVLRLSELLKDTGETTAYKKRAIELGIQHAKGELIITSDADCRRGKNWLAALVSFYEQKRPAMIAAPVSFSIGTEVETQNFASLQYLFEKFQSFDLMGMIGVGGAAIANGSPVMCNGANLAYTKKAFEEVGGFKDIDNIASGDDMLLLHKVAERYADKIAFLKHKEAIVYSCPEKTLIDFFNQRIRWASKSSSYKNKWITLILGMVFLFNLSVLTGFVLGLAYGNFYWKLFFIQVAAKSMMDFLFLQALSRFFGEKKLFWLFLPSQFLHIFYIIIIGIAGNFGKYRWKGRIVR